MRPSEYFRTLATVKWLDEPAISASHNEALKKYSLSPQCYVLETPCQSQFHFSRSLRSYNLIHTLSAHVQMECNLRANKYFWKELTLIWCSKFLVIIILVFKNIQIQMRKDNFATMRLMVLQIQSPSLKYNLSSEILGACLSKMP